MQSILYFLFRYGYVLLFVFLQIVSLNLVVRFNPHQNVIFLRSSSQVSGWLLDHYNATVQFFNLSQVAEKLAEENAELRAMTSTFQELNRPTTGYLDSNSTQKYILMAAKVINNSISNLDNYFTLDVGSREGVEKGMGVVQSEGVMGVIIDVSEQYARGISLLHRDAKISVAIERNHFFGTLSWPGGNPKFAKLTDVPKHADIVEGDVLITSGFSALFPHGIRVGEIVGYSLQEGSNFYDIDVKLTNDLSTAHYVYVVKNLTAKEQQELEQPTSQHGKSNH
ncbi:MAG: rod shape-determining protein MreC [Saprospiraceae bacterium]|nr:rod shape-determining protein MreC [Saprospiraceae bacterium]